MSHVKLPVQLAFGTGHWNSDPANAQLQQDLIAALHKHEIKILDTARQYGQGASEIYLGQAKLPSIFKITTKALGGVVPGGSTKAGIKKDWDQTEAALQTKHVDMYLLHAPAEDTPIPETLDAIQALFLEGHFTEFGLSNFSPTQVLAIHTYCTTHSYILPTVYQGIYSPLNRLSEPTLLPLLRRLGIKYQAYSILGSGTLLATPADVETGKRRFDPSTVVGKILKAQYGGESYLRFLEGYADLAEESGAGRAGMAYRWAVWGSQIGKGKHGQEDAVVLGASSVAQLEETMAEIKKGPLEGWVLERLDALWKSVEGDAAEDNFATYKKLVKAGAL